MRKLLIGILLLSLFSFYTTSQEISVEVVPLDPEEESTGILDQYFPVEGLNQWQYEYDISSLEEGIYNLIVRGVDIAGNEVESAAVDVFIDPESDLPRVSLTYPVRGMRISGDLNILGSARDDDGIDRIEVKVGEDDYRRAEGGEYWSMDIQTTDLPDGRYSLTIRGTDINGVTGPETDSFFHIDRTIPSLDILSHKNGDLVSGKISIDGIIKDTNGVDFLMFSVDGGEVFERVRLSGDLEEGEGGFSLDIDTRKMPDGPQIVWFRGTDLQGSSGLTSLLLYIDNIAPQLDFLHPSGASAVNGSFSIMGRVFDQVGVASLFLRNREGESEEILLEPGNPFWMVDVDFSGSKKAVIDFILTDIAGNRETFPFIYDMDLDSDLPEVSLITSLDSSLPDKSRIQGVVIDDDAPAGVTYRLDKGEEIYIESGRIFDFSLPELSPGEHDLMLRAHDAHGIEGLEQIFQFSSLADDPEFYIDSVILGDGSIIPYKTGISLSPEDAAGITGRISFDSGRGTGTVKFSDNPEIELELKKSDAPGTFDFLVNFPKPVPFGFIPIEAKLFDSIGAESSFRDYFWMEDLSKNLSGHGFHLPEGIISLDERRDLTLRYTGYPLKTVETRGTADFLDLEIDGNLITVKANSQGSTNNLVIVGISDRGTEFVSDEISILSDFEPPVFSDLQPESGKYNGSLNISGSVSDDSGELELFYKIGNGEYQSVGTRRSDTGVTFSLNPESSLFSAGGQVLTLLARDSAGRESRLDRAYQISIVGEEPDQVKLYPLQPAKDEVIFIEQSEDGKMLIAAGITGLSEVTRISWSIDDDPEEMLTGFPVVFAYIPIPEPGSHTISFRVEYGEGKSLNGSRQFEVAHPQGELELLSLGGEGTEAQPFIQGGDLIIGENSVLSGRISRPNKYRVTSLRLDDREPQSLRLVSEDGSFNFDYPLKEINYGRHDLEIEFEDEYGRRRESSFFFFALADSEGRSINSSEGLFPLSESVSDNVYSVPPGDDVSFYFNGRAIESASLNEPVDSFSVSFSGEIIKLKAETAAVLREQILEVRTIDGDLFSFGPFSLLSDTVPPELIVDSPISGGYYSHFLTVEGRSGDNLAVTGLEYSLQDQPFIDLIDGSGDAEESSFSGFRKEIDISSLPDGPFHLRLRIIDETGNSSISGFLLIKDTEAPTLVQVLPEENESVNGRFSFLFRAEDLWSETFSGNFFMNGEIMESLEGEEGFSVSMDLSAYEEIPENTGVMVKDTAGNEAFFTPRLFFQPESDLPEIQIQIPEPDALIESDFIVSGTIFDDDGVEKIEYWIDDGEITAISGGNSFEIPVSLNGLTDNEHRMTIKAYDIWGVESELVTLPFRVSLDVPGAVMLLPAIGETKKGIISLSGTAEDKNGISAVHLSLDNGSSYHRAEGGAEWNYALDTRILVDGNYMVLIKVVDGYGIEAVYTSLLTIDNTPPLIHLSNPIDGLGVSDFLSVQMRISDEIGVQEIKYTIKPLNDTGTADEIVELEGVLEVDEVVLDELDLRSISPGRYNLSVFAYDDAENETVVSRNIIKKDLLQKSIPRLLYPLQGASVHGPFRLEGRIEGNYFPETVTLFVNDTPFDVLTPGTDGYFYREFSPEELVPGNLEFKIVIDESDESDTESSILHLLYKPEGPWISIDSIRTGGYVRNRPWIEGRAGYFIQVSDDEVSKELRISREISWLEYSLDNGRSFNGFKKANQWRFRLETQTIQDGELGIMVRAVFKNGETAVSQVFITADDTPPSVAIITPDEGIAFNENINLSGIASDGNDLSGVSVMLRKGSKNSYEIPAFIQGLYIDAHFLGATFWELGAGLTFFDDNVKLQFLLGQSPLGRFNGMVFGFKLLANVATIPYGYLFGPDWDFLSSSVAIGSAFEYFTMSESVNQDGLVLGALVGQIELIKAEFKNLPFLNTYSIYFEDQLWFISSDIQGGLENRIAFGMRINVF